MCGICGIYNFGSGAPVEEAALRSATRALAHRGPDDEGHYVEGALGLGNRRLSIIDLAGGHQPIANEDKSVWITLNGEIYNYRSLREELIGRGHRFATESDTETIVHLYEDFGIECLSRLRGVFAFALWDKRRRRLLVARDRLGVKPLFYAEGPQGIAFASELRALRFLAPDRFETDPQAVYDFFAFRYVPGPGTFYRGVKKLLPGHFLDLTPEGAHLHQYWDSAAIEEQPGCAADYAEQVLAKLRESVGLRLISDVPLGVFLSGGADSSAVVSLMAEHDHRPLRTFSVGFADPAFDERPYARQIAARYETEHDEVTVEPKDILEHLPRLIELRDEPIAEPTDIPLYLLSRLAAQKVKVVLAGEGGDELCAGYPKYVAERWAGWGRVIPAPLLRLLARLLPFQQRRLKLALEAFAAPNRAERAVAWFAAFNGNERRRLFSREFLEQVDPAGPARVLGTYLERSRHLPPVRRLLYADLKVWLPDNLLLRGDHMTMAAGLEERVPFLDHELVELVAKIPTRLLLPGLEPKVFLKRILSPYLPAGFLNRPKVGFRVPVGEWFRKELKELVADLLMDSGFRSFGIFNERAVEDLMQEHWKGRRDNQKQLWALINFALWQRGRAPLGVGDKAAGSPTSVTA